MIVALVHCGLVLCAPVLCLVTAGGAPSDPFARRTLALEPVGQPDSILTADLDGDGFSDLILRDRGDVSVFFHRVGNDMPTSPDLTFVLPADTIFVDLDDLDGDDASELGLMTPEGIKAISFVDRTLGAPQRVEALCRDDLILSPVPASDIRWSDFLLDIDGQGAPDALLATEEGYRILLRGDPDAGFVPSGLVPVMPVGTIDLSSRSDLGEVSQTLEMPRVFVGDVDGDAVPEVFTFDGRTVRVFARPQERDGDWPEIAERTLYDAQVSLPEEYLSSRLIEVADLDGDGRAGLMVVRSMEGALDFFSTGEEGLFSDRRSLQLEGWILPPDLMDLDGDGRPDLVAPTVEEIGYMNLAKIFVSRTLRMKFWSFKNRLDVRFARAPDGVREISVPLKYDSSGGGTSVEYQTFHSFDGDFDGDGKNDMIVKTGADIVEIFRGLGDGSFSAEPSAQLPMDDSSEYLTVEKYLFDLNVDGRCDLLLHYRGSGELRDKYRLLLSGD